LILNRLFGASGIALPPREGMLPVMPNCPFCAAPVPGESRFCAACPDWSAWDLVFIQFLCPIPLGET
jgi:hypothetical protein